MKTFLKITIPILALLLITLAAILIIPAYKYRFSEAVLRDTLVKVYPQTSIEELSGQFQQGGIIANAQDMVAHYNRNDPQSLKPGSYALERGMSYRTLLTRIENDRQTPVRLTFNNVRTLNQLAGRVARYTMADSLAFVRYFHNDSMLSSLNMTMQTLPALFLPNTYEIYWTITPQEFVEKMNKQYTDFWGANDRKEKAAKLGLTPLEVSTIASIVIEETKAKSEMTTVAGVYINRLRAGMPLQADPTVKFALGDFAIKRVLNKHLETQSPYNTYKNNGLPPGPIAIPPAEVIDAVLKYEGHNYLYFCANADFSGTHAFATNLTLHNKNAQAYQKELNRRKIK